MCATACSSFIYSDPCCACEGDSTKLKLNLWTNSGGIEAITQFIIRSLLHVMLNPVWGVKTASESAGSGSFLVPSRPQPPSPQKPSPRIHSSTLHLLFNSYIRSVSPSFFKKAPSSAWHSRELRDMLQIRLNPHPCLISCATVLIKHERDATGSGWAEFYQCKFPQLLL